MFYFIKETLREILDEVGKPTRTVAYLHIPIGAVLVVNLQVLTHNAHLAKCGRKSA